MPITPGNISDNDARTIPQDHVTSGGGGGPTQFNAIKVLGQSETATLLVDGAATINGGFNASGGGGSTVDALTVSSDTLNKNGVTVLNQTESDARYVQPAAILQLPVTTVLAADVSDSAGVATTILSAANLASGHTYRVHFRILLASNSANTNGCQMGFSADPTASLATFTASYNTTASTAVHQNGSIHASTWAAQGIIGSAIATYDSSGTNNQAFVDVDVTLTLTAGPFTLRIQLTRLTSGTMTAKAGSYMEVVEVA